MSGSTESEARKALGRFVRALEKADRELGALEGALRRVEDSDFPEAAYRDVRDLVERAQRFAQEEGDRLREKVLTAGGLEPGRVRRSGGLDGSAPRDVAPGDATGEEGP